MAIHWFHPPVFIETDQPGLTYVCTNVEGAAAELMKWTKRGPKWKEAVEVCMGLLEGEGTVDYRPRRMTIVCRRRRLLSWRTPAPN
ncbi:DUF982 domain-containing protein [Mesorhizobium delmotii]|uniref:DUF982 domain-containing protein n=1 Tax=Mesorhizobium delmotii TaxID=1631247 RepID=A0A2P9AS89_9HYPH|nr:DUF982 domain-containing protein [Mesorhizobium delmotii]SJM34012.1 hypothetical protein BQ8482_380195 [Mesorhizobium delmotii]